MSLSRSIEFVLELGVERVRAHDLHLAHVLIEGLRPRDAEVVSPLGAHERSAIVTARLPGSDPAEIAAALGEARVVVSSRSDGIRFSPHLYNNEADVERALECIDEIGSSTAPSSTALLWQAGEPISDVEGDEDLSGLAPRFQACPIRSSEL